MGRNWWIVFFFFAVIGSAACRKNHGGSTPDRVPARPTVPAPQNPALHSLRPVNTSIGERVAGFYEALPPGYDTATGKRYPLIVFLHGGGEVGNGGPELSRVLRNSLPKRINKREFPVSFKAKGTDYSFIVIMPQFNDWPGPFDVKGVLEYALKHYRVDSQRVYLSGLSMGGGATWEYAGVYGAYVAAIVPICGASWADSTIAVKIATAAIPVWAFHNKDDKVVPYSSTTRYVNFINALHPKVPVKMTLWESGGHDAWTKASDPQYREENMNIYEWMLQHVRQ